MKLSVTRGKCQLLNQSKLSTTFILFFCFERNFMLFSLHRFKWHQRHQTMPKPVSIREKVTSKKKNEIAFLFSEAWRETSYHKNKENRSGGKPVPGRSVLLINIYWFCDQTEFRLWKEGSKVREKCVLVEKGYGTNCFLEV